MRCAHARLLLVAPLAAACAGSPDRHTLAELRRMEPDVSEVRVENSLDQAIELPCREHPVHVLQE